MKCEKEILDLVNGTGKNIEKTIGIKIRNGQQYEAVKKTLQWVMKPSFLMGV